MLPRSRQRILDRLRDDDVVLDIGAWADPFWRADWVMDMMPYETRGLYEREGWTTPAEDPPERFGPGTWIERDVCDREPFPFEDDAIDFVICSHTLEDLRDPVWVCGEIARVGKSGYIELPSRIEEQCWGVCGDYVGWSHHRWLTDVGASGIDFVQKFHSIHVQPEHYFPPGFVEKLAPEERVQTLWWEGGFSCAERVIHDEEENAAYLRPVIERGLAAHPGPYGPPPARSRRQRLVAGLRRNGR